jgi:hypothetical protein
MNFAGESACLTADNVVRILTSQVALKMTLLRNGLRNPVIPPLLGADDTGNTASSTVACWTLLLPGNALIKSVTILSHTEVLYALRISTMHGTCHVYSILFVLIVLIIGAAQILKVLILLSTFCSQTHSRRL